MKVHAYKKGQIIEYNQIFFYYLSFEEISRRLSLIILATMNIFVYENLNSHASILPCSLNMTLSNIICRLPFCVGYLFLFSYLFGMQICIHIYCIFIFVSPVRNSRCKLIYLKHCRVLFSSQVWRMI